MAQVNIIQYAEVQMGDGNIFRIGSKHLPSTISLTGTGAILRKVWNDLAATTAKALLTDEDLTDFGPWVFMAVKSSKDSMLSWESVDANDTSAIKLESNIWHFFTHGVTSAYAAGYLSRVAETPVDILGLSIYPSDVADVELVILK